MIKKTVALLLAVCTLFSVCYITPYGADIAYTEEGGGITITSWNKNDSYTVEVPGEIDGVPVVAIGAGVFKDCRSIYEIILPDSVTKIDASAFVGCASLRSLTVSESNTAFKNYNGNLYTKDMSTLVKFCDVTADFYSAPTGVTTIGPYAFYGMDGIRDFYYSSPITNIGEYAFYGCSELRSFSLSNLVSAGKYAFYGCRAFTSVNVGVEDISEGMFFGCENINSLTVSKSLRSIGKFAFAGCYSLDSVLIPAGAQITNEAFFGTDTTLYGDELTEKYANENGNKYIKAVYTGAVPVSSISFTQSELNVRVDDVITPEITVSPENAEVKEVIFKSSDENIVKIENGKLTAVATGSAVITAKSVDGVKSAVLKVNVSDREAPLQSSHPYASGLNEKYTYTVPGEPEKIAVTFSHDTYVEDGEDFILVMDKNSESIGTYTAGQLAGKTLLIDGDTVNITLISDDDIQYFGFCIIKAEPYESSALISEITFKETELTLDYGQSYDLEYTYTPADTLSDIQFISSDSDVVTVDEDGKIYAINAGSAFVIIYDTYSGKTAQCEITVEKKVYEGILYSVVADEIALTHYEGEAESINIPAEIDGLPVTTIAEGAFMYSPTVKTVFVPASVSSIHSSAFVGCKALTEINVDGDNEKYSSSNGVLYDKAGAYLIACPAGKTGEFTVPDGVEAISQHSFNMCVGITKITFSSTVQLIPQNAFLYCEELGAFAVDASEYYCVNNGVLYTSDMGALVHYPTSKNGDYVMPDSIEVVKDGAFLGCTNLTTLTLSPKLSEIEKGAFSDIVSLEKIECPEDNPFFVSENGVLYNKNKTSIIACPTSTKGEFNIPSGVTTIGKYAFKNCAELSSIYIPLSVTSIGQQAFYGADAVSVIVLPPNVTSVGDFAFDKCSNIRVFAPNNITAFGVTDGGVTVLCGAETATKENAVAAGYSTEDITYSSSDSGMAFYYGDIPQNTMFSAQKVGAGKKALVQDILPNEEIEVFVLSFDGYMTDKEYTATVFCNPWIEGVYKLENGELKEVFFDTTENGVMLSTKGGVYAFSYGDRISDHSELSVKTMPNKTEYAYGEEFDKNGLSVYFKNHTGLVTILSDDSYTVEDVKLDRGGYHNVTVSYEAVKTSFTVTVKTEPLSADIRIEGTGEFGTDITLFIENVNFDYIPYEITWYRDGELIQGENETTYTVCGADSGKNISAKVTASNGCEGQIESNTVYVEILVMSSEVYSINTESSLISKISAETTVEQLLAGLTFKENVKVYNGDKELAGDEFVTTGSELRLYSGDNIAQKLTVIVTGDINGDGKITLIDFANIKAYMLGEKEFTSYDKYAADANGDGSLSLIDFAQFKAHMLGDLTIEGKEY